MGLTALIAAQQKASDEVKGGEAGSGDFAKQNTTPYPLRIRCFLLSTACGRNAYPYSGERGCIHDRRTAHPEF